MIDDSFKYAKNVASFGIPVIMFGHYPWNRPSLDEIHRIDNYMIMAANTWDDVVRYVYHRLNVISSSLASSTSNSIKYPQLDEEVKVAAIQLTSTNDKALNVANITRLVQQAVDNQAKFVCLPECCTFLGEKSSDLLGVAEEVDEFNSSSTVYALCQLAKQHQIWLSVGGFPEKCVVPSAVPAEVAADKVYNSHLVINPNGLLQRPWYRKIHLFDNPLTGLQESLVTGSCCVFTSD